MFFRGGAVKDRKLIWIWPTIILDNSASGATLLRTELQLKKKLKKKANPKQVLC